MVDDRSSDDPDHRNLPTEVDSTVPSIARTYDYLLGGKDNFAIDREIGDKFLTDMPDAVQIALDNRAILVRAVRYMAEDAGLDQFIDLGSGLPTAENVHQVAQRVDPDAHVVYVDRDPMVLAHGRALLEENANTTVVQADIRDPEQILGHPDTRRLIDFSRPVGLIACAILHHILDTENPGDVLAALRAAVPTGSHLFLTHFRDLGTPESDQAQAILLKAFGRGVWRTDEEIAAFFTGWDLVEPGIVPVAHWHPDAEPEDEPLTVWQKQIVGGVGVKP